MTQILRRLTENSIRQISTPGYRADGGGLYLQVSRSGSKSWIYRYSIHGRTREAGLGSLRTVGLTEARRRAAEYRLLRDQGIDPIDARNAQRAPVALQETPVATMTFRECASQFISERKVEWRNEKHREQWTTTLTRHVYPFIGDLPVADINTELVITVLKPIWWEIPETANRIRGRIEAVLAWASVHGHREGSNPAVWKGHLKAAFPAHTKVRKPQPHPALPYPQVPAFMSDLRERGSITAMALEFTILTAARSGETFGARWSEIDFDAKAWTVPACRMKAGRPHIVPLSDRALVLVEGMRVLGGADVGFIFPGARAGRPLSSMAMLMCLEGMHRSDVTVHGFRSSFRDWCADQTDFPREVAEAALAHVVGDKTEAAYFRTTMLAKRRALMNEWATFCLLAPSTGAVVQTIALKRT